MFNKFNEPSAETLCFYSSHQSNPLLNRRYFNDTNISMRVLEQYEILLNVLEKISYFFNIFLYACRARNTQARLCTRAFSIYP